jgi:transcriptional regulator with XRE-family HTH domain
MRAMELRVNGLGIAPEKVKRARAEAGLSQAELAARIGCSARSVQNWEMNGKSRRPHSRYIRSLAEATGKPIAWFFEDSA